MPGNAPFLGLPRGLDAWAAAVLTAAFALLFAALYGGASLLTGLDPRRLDVALPFERAIPFVPAAAAVYLSGTVLLALAPFVLRRRRDLWALFCALAAETVAGAALFLALPVRGAFPERQVEEGGLAAALFRFADDLNLERNELPSLHVALALTAALAYGRGRGPLARALLAAWALAVAASAVLIHEHHLLDVAAGLALGAAGWRIAGGRARRPEAAAAFEVDLLCLREVALFGRRHPRYWLIGLFLLGASLPRWRSRRVLRTGFCLLQHADDLLDGDRPCEREPLEAVDELIAAIESGRFGAGDRMRLAEAFSADLRRAGGEPALATAVDLLRTMQRDRRRVLERTLLDRRALLEHHRATFTRSLDLMLTAAGSDLRSADVPELADALGWCSAVRDLREDLEAGLVNLPREVIEAARAEGCRSLAHDELLATAAVRAWLAAELARAGRLLDAADRRLEALRGRRGERALRLFARSIRGFAERRFPRRFPGVRAAQGTEADQAEVSPLSRPSEKIVSPAGGGGAAGVPARR